MPLHTRKLHFQTAAVVTALLAGTLAASSAPATARPAPADRDQTPAARAVGQDGRVRIVKVHADTLAERNAVVALGLDMTEGANSRGIGVVLHGARDARILRAAGFEWTVQVADLAAADRANARADRRYARSVASSPLPSGRNHYRTYADYNREMKRLAARHPRLVKPLTLKHRTVAGRLVHGIEITSNAAAVRDGKPILLMLGLHHVREWPAGEHAMEFAYDLIRNYAKDDRATRIVDHSRVIVVPVVNPDGFRVSRRGQRLGDFSQFDYSMKRKNCGISAHTPARYRTGTCPHNPAGRLRGTDLNRNYPGFWGGPGASTRWYDDTYRGDAPGSSPEVSNIRGLISHRQVTALITNHTYSNLVLRPPSIADTGRSPDEPLYKALGDKMAAANGYTSEPSYQLYDTSGSTEDWSYWNTGGFGFTFEIGNLGFHPPYEKAVVDEYLGLGDVAGAGSGGNREAYYRMALANLQQRYHSTIVGRAPSGYRLMIRKQFISPTAPVLDANGNAGAPRYYRDKLVSALRSDGGRFRWAVNPSTRPVVAGRYGRDPVAPPQDDIVLVNPPGIPPDTGREIVPFTILGPPDADNGTATISVRWDEPSVDWDIYVVDRHGAVVGQAASLDDPEVITLVDPAPGRYRLVVENYSGGEASDWSGTIDFAPPTPATYSGLKEAWVFSCADKRGSVVATRRVVVDRGEVARIGAVCSAAAGKR